MSSELSYPSSINLKVYVLKCDVQTTISSAGVVVCTGPGPSMIHFTNPSKKSEMCGVTMGSICDGRIREWYSLLDQHCGRKQRSVSFCQSAIFFVYHCAKTLLLYLFHKYCCIWYFSSNNFQGLIIPFLLCPFMHSSEGL